VVAGAGRDPSAAVLAVSDAVPNRLVLEWIDEGGRGSDQTEQALGTALAALHAAGAPAFGREDRRTTGSAGCQTSRARLGRVYRENRLLVLARLAREANALPSTVIAQLERVASRLEGFGAADEPPARLHGDLWAGNRLVDARGRSWLIDPAAHGDIVSSTSR